MSQTTAFPGTTPNRISASPAADGVIAWVFIVIGMIAPLALVAAAGLMSTDALDRAQIIVLGTERLALLLMGAVLVTLLYVLGQREARVVVGDAQTVEVY